MERDLLTAEQRREQCDSRPRIKFVKKGQSSPSVSPFFGGPTESVSETPHYRALENLAKSENQWLTLKKTLSHDEGVRALKTLTERNQVLAATIRANLSSGTLCFWNQMPTEQIRPSQPKRKLDYLVVNDPSKVEIFRKFLNRKSGRELFKPFKGKIVKVTGSTYITDREKVIRRNHIAVRLKSTSVGFSGKQATPVKKGQKRPIVSTSSSTSSEDRWSLKQPNQKSRITAKTVSIPLCSRPPLLLSSSTPLRANSSASKLVDDTMLDAQGIRPIIRDATPVVDLTASSSTSAKLLPDVPISVKPQVPSSSKSSLMACPDLAPISSDEESSVPKLQKCSKSSISAVAGSSHRDMSVANSDVNGNISSESNSSCTSSRHKKQTSFYGSPINDQRASKEANRPKMFIKFF